MKAQRPCFSRRRTFDVHQIPLCLRCSVDVDADEMPYYETCSDANGAQHVRCWEYMSKEKAARTVALCWELA